MSGVEIREYRDGDGGAVRELFSLGMSEHVPAAFVHLLKQPPTQMVLMCTFCTLLATSKSFMLPVLAVTLLLAATRQLLVYKFNNYIESCHGADLKNIGESYTAARDSCFWVAESDGCLVGTVACLPRNDAPDCLELKRMSVRRSHRRMGVAKELCRKVVDFTRRRGYAAVVLITSVVQTDAQKLYEGLGFRKVREFLEPDVASKVSNFLLFEYRLDLRQDHAEK
ncbi:probable N-acetyltransferase camello [Syngnathoides biaculeatus]|uniref:probable N-acetyltransferase camello n=1 Tax=Syngnathoides biaculeatus TaxID=300417 RepID=UPI002ADE66A9|nr:probable N-acetyltransferase camello [Syngnathoides biaculeatus]